MANGKSNVNVKIDAEVKDLATQLLGRMGIDQTTAIDMFYRQIIAERRLPFQPVVTPTLDERLTEAIWKSNPEKIEVDVDENGNILIDKDKNPDLHDWAVNG
jgi:DNA-damage-inducible protein J